MKSKTIKKENVVNIEIINRTIGFIEYKLEETIDMLRWENEKENSDTKWIESLEWEITDTKEIIEQLKTIKN
tara:strand:+ start:667 stop:882 length:216 start_codon:yes stop_codon:yes gene_type:complete